MKGLDEMRATQNGLMIQRLIIERRTATQERQKEINDELATRYNKPHNYA